MSLDLILKNSEINFKVDKPSDHKVYEFEEFRLDAGHLMLYRDSKELPLTPKAVETLLSLITRRGDIVSKDELMSSIWTDSIVEESNLSQYLHHLRKTLGKRRDGKPFIETLKRRGYRFNGDVTVSDGGNGSSDRRAPYTGKVGDISSNKVVETSNPVRSALRVERRGNVLALADWNETDIPIQQAATQTPGATKQPPNKRRRIIGITLVCFLFAGIAVFTYGLWGRPGAAITDRPVPRTIAVLPFKVVGGSLDNEYLGIGMSEALIMRLGNNREILVRPTSSIRQYTDPNQDPIAIGRLQKVEAVLDGSIQHDGSRIRVSLQLISVADGIALWTGRFDEPLSDIFSLQDSISQRVTKELAVELKADAGQIRPPKIEAYHEYLKGRYFWNKRSREGHLKAEAHFSRAIEIDPAYARAYAGLADAYAFKGGHNSAEENEAFHQKSRELLLKASELDSTLAEPHATLGLFAMNRQQDWAEAEREFRRSIELDPNYPTARHWYGEFLGYMGRFDEGIAELRRAEELDPLSPIISTDLGQVYYHARRYDEAVRQLTKVLEMDPNFTTAHRWLALTYSAQGRHDEALRELEGKTAVIDDQIELSILGYLHGRAGQSEKSWAILERLNKLSGQEYVLPSNMIRIYAGLGEKDKAFEWMEPLFEQRDVSLIALKVSPLLDPLRDDPRYPDILRRAGFAP